MTGKSIAENLKEIEGKIQKCASHQVCIVGASKSQSIARLREAYAAGIRDFGENYAQEALDKQNVLSELSDVRWHFIGHLQSNKVKDVVGKFTLIHSLDRVALGEAISKRARLLNLRQDCLLEVNFAGEESKSGAPPDEAKNLIVYLRDHCPGVRLRGLMCMPPATREGENSRTIFRRAKLLTEELAPLLGSEAREFSELSMGTSQDYLEAASEGSTLVRLGTCLFGERSSHRKEVSL